MKQEVLIITAVIIVLIGGAIYWFESDILKIANKSNESFAEDLTNQEIENLSRSIVHLQCWANCSGDHEDNCDEVYGSGTLINRSMINGIKVDTIPTGQDGFILTNAHVTELQPIEYDLNFCVVETKPNQGSEYGEYWGLFYYSEGELFLDGDDTDIAILWPGPATRYDEIADRQLKNIEACPRDKVIGSRVHVLGYPVTGSEIIQIGNRMTTLINIARQKRGEPILPNPKITDVLVRNLIVSTGIISGLSSNENYFTDAEIDSGSSGGLAVSKIDGEVCIVGIPTWISGGNYETLGLIQPYWKVLDVFKEIEFK